MSSDTSHDRLIGTVSLILDRMVHVRLTAVGLTRPEVIDRTPSDPVEFWEQSRVHDPRSIRVNREWESLGGPTVAGTRARGRQRGTGRSLGEPAPGGDGARPARARTGSVRAPAAWLCGARRPAYDRWLAKQMRLRGAHTARLDLPVPPAGGRFPVSAVATATSASTPRTFEPRVRQSVEDAAAVIAWARAEVSPHVGVVGVSLGGLIATLLATQLELDRVIAVAPFCDPATTLSQRPPTPSLRHLGMIGEFSGSWGPDRASAGRFLDSTLAPLRARNLAPTDARGPHHPGSRDAGPGRRAGSGDGARKHDGRPSSGPTRTGT